MVKAAAGVAAVAVADAIVTAVASELKAASTPSPKTTVRIRPLPLLRQTHRQQCNQ